MAFAPILSFTLKWTILHDNMCIWLAIGFDFE